MKDLIIVRIIVHKEMILSKWGVDRKYDLSIALKVWEKDATKAVGLCEVWNVDPKLFVDAAFAYALDRKWRDGPLPTFLGSSKWMRKALAFHLDMPGSAVDDVLSTDRLVKQMDKKLKVELEFIQNHVNLHGLNIVQNLQGVTPEARFLWNPCALPVLRQIGRELLEIVERDRRSELLMAHRKWDWQRLTKHLKPYLK